MPSARIWRMFNSDNGDLIEGQFEAEGVTRNVSSTWADKPSLNRASPLTQFLHGNADTLTFQARLYAENALQDPTEVYNKIVEWAKRDPFLKRPPIVLFVVGDANPAYGLSYSTIRGVSDAQFDAPTILGAVRGLSFSVSLQAYEDFEVVAREPPSTRYARASDGDYMEMLAYREYRTPMIGVVLRDQHPETPLPSQGDVVKLPSLEAIRTERIEPKSTAFAGLRKRKDSPQKRNRDFHFDRTNRVYYSNKIPQELG